MPFRYAADVHARFRRHCRHVAIAAMLDAAFDARH